MPKNKKKHSSSANHSDSGMTVLPFANSFSVTLASGAATLEIAPPTTSATRVTQTADAFEFYRITKLSYRLRRTNQTQPIAATWVAGLVDNVPATVSQITQSPYYTLLMASDTLPSNWVRVPRSALKSYAVWYKTVSGTIDTGEEVQGKIFLCGNAAENVYVDVKVVYEFKMPVNTGITPEERRIKAVQETRKKLLDILFFDASRVRLEPAQPSTLPSVALPVPVTRVTDTEDLSERLRRLELLLKGPTA